MNHSFDTDIAESIGLPHAIMLQHLYFWHQKNEANDKHYIDDRYWTYNSVKGFSVIFPYLTAKKISRVLKDLESGDYIVSANHNEVAYDRTLWYALTEKALLMLVPSIIPKGKMHSPKKENAFDQMGKPIPDSNTYKKTIYAFSPKINQNQLAFLKRIVSDFYQTKHKQYPNHIKSNWHQDDKLTHESVNVLFQLITLDKWGENDVRDVIRWATTDTFWQSNLLSLRILRNKSKNGMTKFANLHIKFKQ